MDEKVSIVIPARNEPYLQQTLLDIFRNSQGPIQVIVVMDGDVLDRDKRPEELRKDSRLTVLERPLSGMRASINAGVAAADGKYLLKVDAHCSFDPGFDCKLKEACEETWCAVPTRYKLNVHTWERMTSDVFEFKYIDSSDLKGRRWEEYGDRVKGQMICDLMTTQGSCWFMHRKRFEAIGGLDAEHYGWMGREAQELCLKVWLSGGRFILNRNTWYAHWTKQMRRYPGMKDQRKKSEAFIQDYWKNNRWPLQTRTLQWLIDYFAPVPSWHIGDKDGRKAL